MVLIMLVSYKCVCPGDLISANNAAIIRPPIGQWKHINNLTLWYGMVWYGNFLFDIMK